MEHGKGLSVRDAENEGAQTGLCVYLESFTFNSTAKLISRMQ